MVRSDDFDATVRLPVGLDIAAIRRAVEYIERELAERERRLEEGIGPSRGVNPAGF